MAVHHTSVIDPHIDFAKTAHGKIPQRLHLIILGHVAGKGGDLCAGKFTQKGRFLRLNGAV